MENYSVPSLYCFCIVSTFTYQIAKSHNSVWKSKFCFILQTRITFQLFIMMFVSVVLNFNIEVKNEVQKHPFSYEMTLNAPKWLLHFYNKKTWLIFLRVMKISYIIATLNVFYFKSCFLADLPCL